MLNPSVNNDDGNSGWTLAVQRAESLRQRAEGAPGIRAGLILIVRDTSRKEVPKGTGATGAIPQSLSLCTNTPRKPQGGMV